MPAAGLGRGILGTPAQHGHVNFANWPLYVDPGHQTLQDFTAATGITVSYAEVIQDDESWYDDINPILRAGESIGYDIMVVTDGFQFSELVSQGELTPLDQGLMQTKVATSDLVFLRAAEYARLRNYADVSGRKQEQYLSIFQPIIGG